jgi:hypothetical protein
MNVSITSWDMVGDHDGTTRHSQIPGIEDENFGEGSMIPNKS